MAKTKRRKRGYGSGSIVPPTKPGGPWGIRIRVNGKRTFRGGMPSKEFAEKTLAKLQADGAAENFGLPVSKSDGNTLGDHAIGFCARRLLTNVAGAEDQGRWNNHLQPTFGHLRPAEVDASLMRRFIEAKLAEGLKPGTVRILVALLSSLYTDLVEDKLAPANPARGLPRKTMRLIQPDHDPRTTPFIEKLSDVERIFRDLPEPLHIAYALGALAGLRTSEAAGLRWRSIDLVGRRIHVREQSGKRKGQDTVRLKDKDSRIVPILSGLLPVLQAWKLKTGGAGDDRVVPPMRIDGRTVQKGTRGKYLRATLAKFGLERPGLGWYEATRHTFASQWVMNGGSIEKLKEILGHYSVVMTEKYAHLRPDLFAPADLDTIPLTLGSSAGAVVALKAKAV